jgi:hypothetical protein
VQGSLDQFQSSDQLIANLMHIKSMLQETKKFQNSYFNNTYGRFLGEKAQDKKEDPLGIR